MRKAALIRSILRLLEPGVEVIEAAYVWRRHRHVIPYSLATFVAMVTVATATGWTGLPERVGLGLAAVGLATAATTDYRIVASTSKGPVLFKASRIRQAATAVVGPLRHHATIREVGRTMLTSDWEVDGTVYTVPRFSDTAMLRLAGGG